MKGWVCPHWYWIRAEVLVLFSDLFLLFICSFYVVETRKSEFKK